MTTYDLDAYARATAMLPACLDVLDAFWDSESPDAAPDALDALRKAVRLMRREIGVQPPRDHYRAMLLLARGDDAKGADTFGALFRALGGEEAWQ